MTRAGSRLSLIGLKLLPINLPGLTLLRLHWGGRMHGSQIFRFANPFESVAKKLAVGSDRVHV